MGGNTRTPRLRPGTESLATTSPLLAAEWVVDLNDGISPDLVSGGSNYRAWWRAACGHAPWQAPVGDRVVYATGCPTCSGRRIEAGVNDLATIRPDLAAEWDAPLNGEFGPTNVPIGAKRRVWWRAACGHAPWAASVKDRTRSNAATGCPTCAGKRVETGVNDLGTVRPDLAAEWHATLNGDRTPDTVSVASMFSAWWVKSCGHAPFRATVATRTSMATGCPTCAGKRVEPGVNDLPTTHPHLAAEFAVDLNGGLRAQQVSAGSNRRVWWRAPCGHEPWTTAITNRTGQGQGCPACALAATSAVERILFEVLADTVLAHALHGRRIPVVWGGRRRSTADVDIVGTYQGHEVVVEYDGEYWHRSRVEPDTAKTRALLEVGYWVVRVRSGDLPHLDLTHPRLLQIGHEQRHGPGRLDSLTASLAPVHAAIGAWLAGTLESARTEAA